jgi:SAM-dependent methyltransferase
MDNINYWNNFYKNSQNLLPSQFAVFIASEYPDKKNLIDFGCGSARDTFFLSKLYKKVIGIDASSEIINSNNMSQNTKKNLTFLLNDLSNEKLLKNLIQDEFKDIDNCIFYARFFLHAIDESVEDKFLKFYNNLKNRSNILALEFRTNKDQFLEKEYGNHYRRFVDPKQLISKLDKMGMIINYFIEGQGYAKYKNDDAYVARLIVS